MTSPHRIPWSHEQPDGAPFKAVRHCRRPGEDVGPHQHEFAEVFWIEAGVGTHLANGRPLPLQPGQAWFVRPADLHAITIGPDGLTLVNVSFPPAAAGDLARRAGPAWPWRSGPLPACTVLGRSARDRLLAWASDLARPDAGRLDLDAFLLDLARLCARPAGSGDLPGWLADALEAFADPVHLHGGSPALARLCGRGPAHLNRTVRACRGCTATDLVNQARLDWAARELRLGRRSVAEVAESCGLPHLGHFYHLFHRRFGTTPARWRRAADRVFQPRA